MKKVLFVATVDSHIVNFHIPYLKWFKEEGYEVHVATSENSVIPYTDNKHIVSFCRKPFKINNIKAYFSLKKLIENNEYELIHCHTPVGGVITRLAGRKVRKKKTKIIYTAHGFHFYKGAGIKSWLLFYFIEKWMSKYTDCLITLNKEDYNIAKNKFKAKETILINGVGVNTEEFTQQTKIEKEELRNKYNYKKDDFILLYAADITYRKHHDLLIESINLIKEKIPEIKLLLAGDGDYINKYKEISKKYKLEKEVNFLGHRNDISNLMKLSDIGVSSSRQEGLPVNVMEAMAVGLPLIVTNCRGNRDLIKNDINGYVVGINDPIEFSEAILKLYQSKEKREEFSKENIQAIKKYSLDIIMKDMIKVYQDILSGDNNGKQ